MTAKHRALYCDDFTVTLRMLAEPPRIRVARALSAIRGRGAPGTEHLRPAATCIICTGGGRGLAEEPHTNNDPDCDREAEEGQEADEGAS